MANALPPIRRPTGVINASLVGVIEEASKHKEIDKLAVRYTRRGIGKEHFIDLKPR